MPPVPPEPRAAVVPDHHVGGDSATLGTTVAPNGRTFDECPQACVRYLAQNGDEGAARYLAECMRTLADGGSKLSELVEANEQLQQRLPEEDRHFAQGLPMDESVDFVMQRVRATILPPAQPRAPRPASRRVPRRREHRPRRRTSSSSRSSSADPPGDSEPGEPVPLALTLAPKPKAILTFGLIAGAIERDQEVPS